jgi:hypothetical protein
MVVSLGGRPGGALVGLGFEGVASVVDVGREHQNLWVVFVGFEGVARVIDGGREHQNHWVVGLGFEGVASVVDVGREHQNREGGAGARAVGWGLVWEHRTGQAATSASVHPVARPYDHPLLAGRILERKVMHGALMAMRFEAIIGAGLGRVMHGGPRGCRRLSINGLMLGCVGYPVLSTGIVHHGHG